MTRILAIDPSIVSMGWAIMQGPENTLLVFGTIKAPDAMQSKPLVERVAWMLGALNRRFLAPPRSGSGDDFGAVIIEQPESWGAFKSLASMHSGGLLSLHIMVGALIGWALGNSQRPVLIKVSKWKGQLPKRVTKKRMEEKYHTTFATDDEADAVGIGDYFLTEESKK